MSDIRSVIDPQPVLMAPQTVGRVAPETRAADRTNEGEESFVKDMFGQLTVFGRTVASHRLELPGIGEVDYSVPDGEDVILQDGDRIRLTVEYAITFNKVGAKTNKMGVGTGERKQVAMARAIVPQCVEIDAVLRREDLEKLWEQEHGATG